MTYNSNDVAIVGMSCKLPNADNYNEFWQNLISETDCISVIPNERWDVAKFYSPDYKLPNKSISKWCGIVNKADEFDNNFFNISPREANNMDPQQRLLLEECYHCIEDAGITLDELQKKRTSVLVGVMAIDYHQYSFIPGINTDAYSCLGNYESILANRISHVFGLTGHSYSLDAACASSLVALHNAKKILDTGECDYVIVGAVNLNLHPWKYISFSKSRMLSPDGKCKTFDMNANGYVPGDGIAAVLLQRLDNAKKNKNKIIGVLKGSAVNHTQNTKSITAPSVESQKDVILNSYQNANIDPDSINYIEAHGTGTLLGDPIEVEALKQVFCNNGKGINHELKIGSVKTNIGHLEAAAGLAGVIKVLLMLKHKKIPKNLNFKRVNPVINLQNSKISFADKLTDWKPLAQNETLKAGVSSFGMGGVNAHVVIEEFKSIKEEHKTKHSSEPFLFMISAKSEKSLSLLLHKWREYTKTSSFNNLSLYDICATLANKKTHLNYRWAKLVSSKEELEEMLKTSSIEHIQTQPPKIGLKVSNETRLTFEKASKLIKDYPKIFSPILDELKEVFKESNGNPDLWNRFIKKQANNEEEQTHFSSLVTLIIIKAYIKIGLDPKALFVENKEDLIVKLLGDAISEKDYVNIISGKKKLSEVAVKRPTIPLFNVSENTIIYPYCFDKQYIQSIFQFEIPDYGISYILQKAHLLYNNQYTFKKYIDEWNELIKTDCFDIVKSIEKNKFKEFSNSEKIILSVAIYCSLEQLNKKWDLSEERIGMPNEFYELTDLIIDGVISKNNFTKWIIKTDNNLENIVKSINDNQHLMDSLKSYPIIKEKNINECCFFEEDKIATSNYNNNDGIVNNFADCILGWSNYGEKPEKNICLDSGESLYYQFLSGLQQLWLKGLNLDFKSLYPIENYTPCLLPKYQYHRNKFKINSPLESQDKTDKSEEKGEKEQLLPEKNIASKIVGSNCFVPKWVETPVNINKNRKPSNKNTVLVVYSDNGQILANDIIKHHQDNPIVKILLSDQNREISKNSFEIQKATRTYLEEIIKKYSDIQTIYFLGAILPQKVDYLNSKLLDEQTEYGLISCFNLIQALENSGYADKKLKLKVVTNNVHHIHKETFFVPYGASLKGFIKSAAKEYHRWDCINIDINYTELNDSFDPNIAHDIVAEGLNERGELVAIRQDKRYVRKAFPVSYDLKNNNVFKEEGVYLIVGGTGGIGLEICRYLCNTFKANVILAGRRSLSDDIKKKIESLHISGGTIEYIQSNLLDQQSLDHTILNIKSKFNRINGVFHCAHSGKMEVIKDMDNDSLLDILSPKVKGSVLLMNALKDESLDFLLFMSSAESFSGYLGQSNYAAASTFEDELAYCMDSVKKYPVRVVNWGFWGTVGMVATEKLNELFASQGYQSISPEEGLVGIENILQNNHTQVLYIKANDLVLKRMEVDNTKLIKIQNKTLPPLVEIIDKIETQIKYKKEDIDQFQEGFSKLEEFAELLLLKSFHEMGVFKTHQEIYEFDQLTALLKISPMHINWIQAMFKILDKADFIDYADNRISTTFKIEQDDISYKLNNLEDIKAQIINKYPHVKSHMVLLWACASNYKKTLQNQIMATEVMFPNSSGHLVEGIYRGNAVSDYCNKIVAECIKLFIQKRKSNLNNNEQIKILEIGSGTGGTSRFVFDAVKMFSSNIRYIYTDISNGFIYYGKKEFKEFNSFVDFKLLDVEKDIENQDYKLGEYDIIFATNVIHATSTLADSFLNIKKLLKKSGWLVLNEITAFQNFTTLTFGSLEGWWLFKDKRLNHAPLLSVPMWEDYLKQNGFKNLENFGLPQTPGNIQWSQHVLISESNGELFLNSQNEKHITSNVSSNNSEIDIGKNTEDNNHNNNVKKDQSNIKNNIIECICSVLEINKEDFNTEAQFSNLGIDSIVGIDIIEKIQQKLGTPIRTMDLFNYPSVDQLSAFIAEKKASMQSAGQKGHGKGSDNTQQPSFSKEQIEDEIISTICLVLEMEKGQFDRNVQFSNLGIDSIIGIDIIEKLQKKLGIPIRTMDLFNYPNISQLSHQLLCKSMVPTN